ncbi:hypothetical protein GLOTRDRAFT_128807 [Gloeophyllum trabeum ATCC 11539]|uniref:Uncharacterized protein n=1 Tax=Gloeophyllum trabeum (strain ATCC 11539 / FP-39264 / Madison 617) TaxID=670483 RepID=S7Q812_GLOTA|nr:uncharacterized protein GLOTRDRAFT_128807 [Gloeophyllum trabeum ATCC 11539]EPQ55583.1 hypothetical protein GLOTRDRAFT_128807 [Gloeophyllum trabeum ATCC 11539]
MQTATLRAPMLQPANTASDPAWSSVGQLLQSAYTLPCSTAAQAFMHLVQPTSRFQLALDALLPLLDARVQLEQRILVSYILFALYTPYPISINPFKSALYATFVRERDAAARIAASGGESDTEQLVWVLWKILKGDGNDLGPYSPNTLARSRTQHPRLRASNLTLDEENPASDPDDMTNSSGMTNKLNAVQQGPSKPQLPQEQKVTAEEDDRNEKLSRAMSLLLAGRSRTLNLSEQRLVNSLIPELVAPPVLTSVDLPQFIHFNAGLAHPLMAALISRPPSSSNRQGAATYVDVLRRLPPTLPSFDLIGRLLRDTTPTTDSVTGGRTTVADIVRLEALGGFVHGCIEWVENREAEQKDGLISDDQAAQGAQNLCRFYNSLIKMGIVDPDSEADSAEMMYFSLRYSRYEDANTLYRNLAAGRF